MMTVQRRFRTELRNGERIPFGFGFAYHEWNRDISVFFLFPLNHAVALWRRFWWWARDARQGERDRLWQRAKAEGWEDGCRLAAREYERGVKAGLRHASACHEVIEQVFSQRDGQR